MKFPALALLSCLIAQPGFAATMPTAPTNAKCEPVPAGEPMLYLRGSLNNWAALDEYAFTYSCDAYYINVNQIGHQEFKIADESWTPSFTYGGIGGGATLAASKPIVLGRGTVPGGAGNLSFAFTGAHTLRLSFPDGQPTLTAGPKTFTDPVRKQVTDPVALSLVHDSRLLADRSPFGAVVAGTPVTFGLRAAKDVDSVVLVLEKRRMEGNQDLLEYTEIQRIPLVREAAGEGGAMRWVGSHAFDQPGIYGYTFEVKIGGASFLYQNNNNSVYWTRERGTNGIGVVVDQPATKRSVRRYRMTVYAADYQVPDWAADALYYYIFPDRFRNGEPGNDPKPGVDRYHDKDVEFHANWNDKPWRPGTGDGSDPVHNNDFFGGDIAGIIEKLDYIASTGANTLYMTPLFTASSNHKYDTADYRNIDPHFGSNDDFSRLTAEAAKRGIRVIPDVSLNHTGSDSIYFDRLGKYGGKGAFTGSRINPGSPYADWYSFDTTQSEPDKMFKGWVGVLDLPELNKASPSFRRFAYGDDDSVMKQWLDRGAAGWRMDVAPWVPDDFWREWRAAIKKHKPDAITIAETWFDASKFFLGDSFDSTMNYIFRNAVLDYANGVKATDMYPSLDYIREAYPPQSLHALMNILSSHDVARSLHVFGYESDSDVATIALAKQRLRLAWFFQMSYPGAPAVYYGDEVGVTGGNDPFNRASYPWADRGGAPDEALLADFKRLVAMRKAHEVLRRGSLSAPLHIDEHVLVLARQQGDAFAITATNNGKESASVTVDLPAGIRATQFVDALTGATTVAEGGRITLVVPAMFGTVLLAR
ncbi:MAG: hypothetical protein A3E01_10560 [Gammaproteobacteria bacterium RIFCSPHIGHO2_12_FULL_63_22]|nr:MAG: hypothetical protein A3E01_10560 [Gammaproteobacteria bacterium RIFCSPHIGHO2_12_FULL_63_22]